MGTRSASTNCQNSCSSSELLPWYTWVSDTASTKRGWKSMQTRVRLMRSKTTLITSTTSTTAEITDLVLPTKKLSQLPMARHSAPFLLESGVSLSQRPRLASKPHPRTKLLPSAVSLSVSAISAPLLLQPHLPSSWATTIQPTPSRLSPRLPAATSSSRPATSTTQLPTMTSHPLITWVVATTSSSKLPRL